MKVELSPKSGISGRSGMLSILGTNVVDALPSPEPLSEPERMLD